MGQVPDVEGDGDGREITGPDRGQPPHVIADVGHRVPFIRTQKQHHDARPHEADDHRLQEGRPSKSGRASAGHRQWQGIAGGQKHRQPKCMEHQVAQWPGKDQRRQPRNDHQHVKEDRVRSVPAHHRIGGKAGHPHPQQSHATVGAERGQGDHTQQPGITVKVEQAVDPPQLCNGTQHQQHMTMDQGTQDRMQGSILHGSINTPRGWD